MTKPLLFAALLLSPLTAPAHPDKIEKDLLLHFATGSHPMENGHWSDLTHAADARVMGSPVMTNIGPARAIVFNGYTDWLEVAPDREAAAPFLPERAFSVTAWVCLDNTVADGGILGFFQDNGPYEKGWLLGYNDNAFSFALATAPSDGDESRLTYLRGRTPHAPGHWRHVAATYDGATMRLYVNGRLDAESDAQSGDIEYPPRGRLALAAYADDNELHPVEGGVFEVKLYGRVLAAAEIESAVDRNRALLEHTPSINNDLQFVVAPYLQHATTNAMTVMAETGTPARMTVQYGEKLPFTNSVATVTNAYIGEVRLTALKPFTRYFYRVTAEDADGNVARSEVRSLQTAPGVDGAWAFGLLGDTQRNPEVTRRAAEGIFELRPNFLLHVGDVVDDGFAKNQWVDDFLTPVSQLTAHVATFPVLGNHERNSHWYYDYFSLPDPEHRYTFHYGNAQFFMIDSNKDCSPGSEQYRWLDEQLAASTATWKIAAHHHPCFSSDENDYGDHWRGREDPSEYTWGDTNARELVALYEKHGVDVVFSGHIHSYERTWPILQMSVNPANGVRYIISGGGGGGLEQAAPQRSWFSIHVQRGHHYGFASVHGRTMQFKAYDLDGRLFDTFELTKPE